MSKAASNKQYLQDFWDACDNGNLSQVKTILGRRHGDLEELLTFSDLKYKLSPLHLAVALGKVEVVQVILAALQSQPALLRSVLLQLGGSQQESPLHLAVNKLEMEVEVVRAILTSPQNQPELLRDVLLQLNGPKQASSIAALIVRGETETIKTVLTVIKTLEDKRPEWIWEIINHKPSSNYLSLVEQVAMEGDKENMKLLLDLNLPVQMPDFPQSGYRCTTPQTAIYYLEGLGRLVTTTQSQKKVTFCRKEEQAGKLEEKSLMDIALSKNPIMVSVVDQKDSTITKTIIAGDVGVGFKNNRIEAITGDLSKSVEFANEEKVNVVVFNVADNLRQHVITVKLEREGLNSKWSTYIHDPDFLPTISEYKKRNVINFNMRLLKEIFSHEKIGFHKMTISEAMIPNFKDSGLDDGYCDIISSIVSAAYVMRCDSELGEYCERVGSGCIVQLLNETNPAVKIILEERLKLFKARLGVDYVQKPKEEVDNRVGLVTAKANEQTTPNQPAIQLSSTSYTSKPKLPNVKQEESTTKQELVLTTISSSSDDLYNLLKSTGTSFELGFYRGMVKEASEAVIGQIANRVVGRNLTKKQIELATTVVGSLFMSYAMGLNKSLATAHVAHEVIVKTAGLKEFYHLPLNVAIGAVLMVCASVPSSSISTKVIQETIIQVVEMMKKPEVAAGIVASMAGYETGKRMVDFVAEKIKPHTAVAATAVSQFGSAVWVRTPEFVKDTLRVFTDLNAAEEFLSHVGPNPVARKESSAAREELSSILKKASAKKAKAAPKVKTQ